MNAMTSLTPAPRVSVIIPAYNAMRYIGETLESLLAQSFTDYEAIIVDDGSKDGIGDWFRTVTDPRIRLIQQANQGPSAARNNGIANSSGELIAFLDADDLWDRDKLAQQVALMDAHPDVGLVYCWLELVDSEGKPWNKRVEFTQSGNVWQTLLIRNIVGCGSSPMIRRSVFDAVGVFDASLSHDEDRDMWLRISEKFDFMPLQAPVVKYRLHNHNISKDWAAMLSCITRVNSRSVERNAGSLPKAEIDRIYRMSMANAYFRSAWAPLQSEKKDVRSAVKLTFKGVRFDPSSFAKARFYKLIVYSAYTALRGVVR